jgi:hypothetical protein
MSANVRLDRLLGRQVHTANNRRVGRLHEFRAERQGADWVITEYMIGGLGLVERLGLGIRLVLGIKRSGGYVARWDQLDLSNPERPKLTCPIKELERR